MNINDEIFRTSSLGNLLAVIKKECISNPSRKFKLSTMFNVFQTVCENNKKELMEIIEQNKCHEKCE